MELKRFVLLNDNRVVEIYKKEKFGYSYVDEVINGIVCTRSILISDVKKTSDNILDLVEVWDLVECGRIVYTVTDIDKWGNLTLNLGDVIEGRNSAITAIYKRQSNGDYKRYEVKE